MIERLRNNNPDWKIYVAVAAAFALVMVFTDGNKYRIPAMVILLLDLVLVGNQLSFDWGDLFLFLGMLIYKGIYEESFTDGLQYAFLILMVYQVGKYVALNKAGDIAVLILAVAFFIPGCVNYSKWFSYKWSYEDGEWPYWTFRKYEEWETPIMSQTAHTLYIVLMGSLLIFWIMMIKKNKVLGIIGTLLSGITLVFGRLTMGKQAVCCSLFALFVSLIVYMIQNKLYKNIRLWHYILAIMDGLAVIGLLVITNAGGFGTWFRHKIWSARDSLYYKDIFSVIAQSLGTPLRYPFGNDDVKFIQLDGDEIKDAKNSWLEIGRIGGLIPLVITIAFTVVVVYCLVHIVRQREEQEKYAILSSFASLSVFCFITSAITDGQRWCVYIFICGLISGQYAQLSNRTELSIPLNRLFERIGIIDKA